MTTFDVAAILLGLASLLPSFNFRTLRLPPTIAMLVAGLVGALVITLLDRFAPNAGVSTHLIDKVNFSSLLMDGMLGFLLFAGSLTVDFYDLRRNLSSILTLASVGVLLSTA